ncbi:MAG: NUDIX hydrolase [Ruminococcus sp.]|nr:NUDIX hydrolase [Ruminococcus sp.]
MNQSEEKNFLEKYKIGDYERPSVAVDIVAFSIRSDENENYKRDSVQKFSLLLIKRGVHPYKCSWALPGGFVRKGETLEECAKREITEETGITPNALMPDAVFSSPGRDPRGWIISNAFVSVMSEENLNASGGDDASDAKWFDVEFTVNDSDAELILSSEECFITAKLRMKSVKFGYPHFEIIDSGGLAFDHAEIIACALYRLRSIIENFDIIFDFLPEKFTLSAMQRVQEAILNKPLLPANFRRKASPYIEETDEYLTGAGHRPAKLFRRKQGG